MSFDITGADGKVIAVPDGEYYFNTKARARRMMRNSLSPEARRVYACLELATMGFQHELAVTMDGRGNERPLTRGDIARQTGFSEAHSRRGLIELEEQGLAERRGVNGGPLHKGKVEIYSWAFPREAKKKKGSQRAAPIPEWFPKSWEPLKPLISRFKLKLLPELGPARGSLLEDGEQVARDYEKAEKGAIALLERVRAGAENGAYKRKNRKNIEREESSSSAVGVLSVELQKAEEEEPPPSYATFKALYPEHRFDEGKTKPAFEALKKTERARVIARLRVYLASPRWVTSLAEDNGKWVPLASNWLKTYEADPPPLLRKHDAGNESLKKQAEHIDRVVKMSRVFRGVAAGGKS